MPVAWVKSYSVDGGPQGKAFTTTMGASTDMVSEGVRRMLVNACYWAAGLEAKISAELNVDIVGEFEPTMYRFSQRENCWNNPRRFKVIALLEAA